MRIRTTEARSGAAAASGRAANGAPAPQPVTSVLVSIAVPIDSRT